MVKFVGKKILNQSSAWVNTWTLLIIIDSCDFILNTYDIVSYTDDNTPYVTRETLESIFVELGKVADTIFKWINDSQMQVNVMFQ